MTKIIFLILLITSTVFADKKYAQDAGTALMAIISASAYGSTFYLDDYDGEIEFYKSLIGTGAVTYGLKAGVDAERPDRSDNDSFPSAHTALSFQSATFIYKKYGINYGIPAYIGAVLVGYSRVYADKHYPSDVFAGAIIGSAFSMYFTSQYKGVQITPLVKNNYSGLRVGYSF